MPRGVVSSADRGLQAWHSKNTHHSRRRCIREIAERLIAKSSLSLFARPTKILSQKAEEFLSVPSSRLNRLLTVSVITVSVRIQEGKPHFVCHFDTCMPGLEFRTGSSAGFQLNDRKTGGLHHVVCGCSNHDAKLPPTVLRQQRATRKGTYYIQTNANYENLMFDPSPSRTKYESRSTKVDCLSLAAPPIIQCPFWQQHLPRKVPLSQCSLVPDHLSRTQRILTPAIAVVCLLCQITSGRLTSNRRDSPTM